jgi:hypothetical protein
MHYSKHPRFMKDSGHYQSFPAVDAMVTDIYLQCVNGIAVASTCSAQLPAYYLRIHSCFSTPFRLYNLQERDQTHDGVLGLTGG